MLEKKLAGKPDLVSPEEDQQDSDNSVCVKELENTSLAYGSNRGWVSSENPTPSPASDPDLLNKQAILCEFLDTIDSDNRDNDVVVSNVSVYCVCSYCKHPPKKGEDLKHCSRLLQRAVPEEGLGLSLVCLFRCGQEVGHCESLNSLSQEPVHICELDLSVFTVLQLSTFTLFTFINTNILQDFILVSLLRHYSRNRVKHS